MTPREVQEKLRRLFEQFRRPLSERTLTDDDKEFIQDLIDLYEQTKSLSLTFSEIVERYEKKLEIAELEKVYYEDELDLINEVRHLQQNTADALKREIFLLSSRELDEATEKELEQKKEFFLELKKAIKTNDEIIAGFEKTEQLTKTLISTTLGITKSYDFGPKSIRGGVEGFAKGLAKTVHPMNMIGSVITRVVEQVMMLDTARASLFQDTFLSLFTSELVNISDDLRSAYGPKAAEVSSQLTAEAQRTIKAFGDIKADGSATRMIALAGQFQKLGVSASATFEINKFLNANLGFASEQQEDVLKQLYAQAQEMERAPEEMFRELAESIPLYSRYGAGFPRVFRGIALAAKKTNVSISDLRSLTENLDTTENAMKQAAQFNSLLGGNFLNGLELLTARAGDKVKIIARAYQRALDEKGQIHSRVLRELYQTFQMDAASFQNMVNAEFSDFERQLAEPPKPTKMQALEIDIQKSLTAQEKIDNKVSENISKITTYIDNEFPSLRNTVNTITNNIPTVLMVTAGLATFFSVGRMALGSRLFPKYVSPTGFGGPGGPDAPGGTGRGTPADGPDRPRPSGPRYDESSRRFRDARGRFISEARARELGLRRPELPTPTAEGPGRLRARTGRIIDAARNASRNVFENMRNSLTRIRGGVSSGLSNVYGSINNLATRASLAAGDLRRAGTNNITSAVRGISERAQKARLAISNFSDRVSRGIADRAQAVRTAASDAMSSATTKVRSIGAETAKTARNVVTGIRETGTAISRSAEEAAFQARTTVSRAATSISTGTQRVVATAADTARAAGRGISTAARATRETVTKFSADAMDKVRNLQPVQQFEKFLDKIPPEKMSKVLKGAGILGTLVGIGSVASILMSDASVEQKARELIKVGSGILGGTMGSVAGSLAGPLGTIVGGIGGALLGDYIGSVPAIQNALLPTVMSLMPGLESEMVNKADGIKIAGEPVSSIKIERIEPVEDTPFAMSVAPKIKAEFETSNDDDVLLKKLVMLKNNLEQIHNKESKVNLTVGFSQIATARVG